MSLTFPLAFAVSYLPLAVLATIQGCFKNEIHFLNIFLSLFHVTDASLILSLCTSFLRVLAQFFI